MDEAASDPQLLQYRTRLRAAVERRDINAVVEAMDPDQLDAPIIMSMSYAIVRMLEVGDGVWSHVQVGDGRSGYVWHAYVRSPIEERAVFNRIDGRWRMTAFVAGD